MRNRVADLGLLTVEANDEVRSDEHAGPVNFVNAVHQIAAGVLLFPHRHQGFWVGTFNADEQREEIRVSHHAQKFVIICKID
jgi:hypothetical protein